MSARGFRFLHATHVGPGRRLTTLPELTATERDLVGRASPLAWDALVEAATVEEVKFLLVTDSSAGTREDDPAAREALRDGLARLDAAEVAVVWVLDEGDSAFGGEEAKHVRFVGGTSDHVDLSADGRGPGVRIEVGGRTRGRDGRVVIGCDRRKLPADDALDGVDPPEGVSYLALRAIEEAGPFGRRLDGLTVRHAGPLTPYRGNDFGSTGATLAEVDRKGRVDARHVPLCPVRRERFVLNPDDGDTPDDLAVKALEEIAGLDAAACERLWLLRWVVATGERSGSLRTPDGFRRFEHDLAAIDPPSAAVTLRHEITVLGGGGSELGRHAGDDAGRLSEEIDAAVGGLRRGRGRAASGPRSEAAEIDRALRRADAAVVAADSRARVAAALEASSAS